MSDKNSRLSIMVSLLLKLLLLDGTNAALASWLKTFQLMYLWNHEIDIIHIMKQSRSTQMLQ